MTVGESSCDNSNTVLSSERKRRSTRTSRSTHWGMSQARCERKSRKSSRSLMSSFKSLADASAYAKKSTT